MKPFSVIGCDLSVEIITSNSSLTSIFLIMIISMAILPIINIEGEKYNRREKACPNYGGEWDDEREVCKIEDDEEKVAY
jgi:hypothetical protein